MQIFSHFWCSMEQAERKQKTAQMNTYYKRRDTEYIILYTGISALVKKGISDTFMLVVTVKQSVKYLIMAVVVLVLLLIMEIIKTTKIIIIKNNNSNNDDDDENDT